MRAQPNAGQARDGRHLSSVASIGAAVHSHGIGPVSFVRVLSGFLIVSTLVVVVITHFKAFRAFPNNIKFKMAAR